MFGEENVRCAEEPSSALRFCLESCVQSQTKSGFGLLRMEARSKKSRVAKLSEHTLGNRFTVLEGERRAGLGMSC